MTSPPASRAAGFFIAVAVLAGAILGVIAGEPSIGVLAGAALGILIALALWLKDRNAG